MADLILASGSLRRKELLEHLRSDFKIISPDIDESVGQNESAQNYVQRLAQEKAQTVLKQYPHAIVIAADTSICIDNEILGKPECKTHAFEIWKKLSGRMHEALTGVCVASERGLEYCVVTTQVKFQKLDCDDMECYWATGEPLGKAGAYAIQGIGARYIPSIIGSYTNVVGLPLHETAMLLQTIEALN